MAERKSFLLRMDPALWGELETWAADELRSVNGQIEYLLKQAVLRRKKGASPPVLSGSEAPHDPPPAGEAAAPPEGGSG